MILIVFVIAIFLLYLLILINRVFKEHMTNSRLPVIHSNSVVLSKRMEKIKTVERDRDYDRDLEGERVFHYITFRLENGRKVEFSVNGYDFNRVKKGTQGKLVYQGTKYISFKK